MNSLVKRIADSLPEPLLQQLKRLHYARTIRNFTEEEEADLKIVGALVEPGDTVVDVGANIGVYTKFLSRYVGGKGEVVSLEPVPTTYKILENNIKVCGLHNVTPLNVAVSDTAGRALMEVPRDESGTRNYYCSRLTESAAEGAEAVEVDVNTLDSLLEARIPRITFIKIDVEGFELPCIRGAKQLFETARPASLVEISGDLDDQTSESAAVGQFFSSLGYEAFWLAGNQLSRRRVGESSVNYFFLTPEHLRKLVEKGLVRSDSEGA